MMIAPRSRGVKLKSAVVVQHGEVMPTYVVAGGMEEEQRDGARGMRDEEAGHGCVGR